MVLKDLTTYYKLFTGYTELRVQENRNTNIYMVNGDIITNERIATSGVSARTYENGVWGFSCDPEISDEAIKGVIQLSAENARFLDSKEDKNGKPLPKITTSAEKDFTTQKPRKSQKDLIEFVKDIDDHIARKYSKISSRSLSLRLLDMEKSLLTSDSSSSYSMTPRSLLMISLTIDNKGEPVALYDAYGGFGHFEDAFSTGDLLFEQLDRQYEDLQKKAEGIYPEAGIAECVLDADLAGVLAHEAIGHTTEADIVRGGSVAGDYLNQKVASELITLVDFANTALGKQCPVPVYVDDEGCKAEDTVIIDRGVLKQFMHNKESANYFNTNPKGHARASGFFDEPLIRMRNTAILPGKTKLEDMIASISNGYYLMRTGNGEADFTSEFMFGIVLGYEIKNGKLGRALRDTTVSGVAFEMLKTVTDVSDDMKWGCWGMCGKKQAIPVGMGGPAIKCKINIGGK